MKKLAMLTFLVGSALISTFAQNNIEILGHKSSEAVFDDFKDADHNLQNGATEYSKLNVGIFWTEENTQNFKAFKFRDTLNEKLVYTISQTKFSFEPFTVYFGKNNNQLNTLDLSKNATVSFDVKNTGTKKLKFEVRMVDNMNRELRYNKNAINDEAHYYNHIIGFLQGDSKSLEIGVKNNFLFDFLNEGVGIDTTSNGNGYLPATINTTPIHFDYSKVTGMKFIVVNDSFDLDFNPKPINNETIEISNFKIGNQNTLGLVTESIDNESNTSSNEDIDVYSILGEYIKSGKENELMLNEGIYIFKSANITRKVMILNE